MFLAEQLQRFNSMIVRLKGLYRTASTPLSIGFNSMIVRLKEYSDTDADHGSNGFNSMIVRLKG